MSTTPQKVINICVALPRDVPRSQYEIIFSFNKEASHVGQMLLFTRACIYHINNSLIIEVAILLPKSDPMYKPPSQMRATPLGLLKWSRKMVQMTTRVGTIAPSRKPHNPNILKKFPIRGVQFELT